MRKSKTGLLGSSKMLVDAERADAQACIPLVSHLLKDGISLQDSGQPKLVGAIEDSGHRNLVEVIEDSGHPILVGAIQVSGHPILAPHLFKDGSSLHQLPPTIATYDLQTTNCHLPTNNYHLPTADNLSTGRLRPSG